MGVTPAATGGVRGPSPTDQRSGLPCARRAARFRGLNQNSFQGLRPEGVQVLRLRHELSGSEPRALTELRTIQYLEETVGPAGLRRLADALVDDERRQLVLHLRRRAASASLELESIIEDWRESSSATPRRPRIAEGGLDAAEIIESFIEVKRGSAELLRRAAKSAPTPQLAERILALSQEEEAAAENLELLARRL